MGGLLVQEDFEMLAWIRDNGGHVSLKEAELAGKARIDKLQNAGLIEYSFITKQNGVCIMSSYWLNLRGLDALSSHEKDMKQQEQANKEAARQKEEAAAQQRHDRISSQKHDYLVALFGAVGGALCTLFFEHFNDIIRAIGKLLNVPSV